MFQGERKLTPLSDLVGATVTSDHKSQTVSVFHLNLPDYAPAEQIGANLPRLHRDLRTGGIGRVVFMGASGETTTFTPEIVGRDRGGSAAAGLKGTEKRVPTYKTSINSNFNGHALGLNQVRWADTVVTLNMSEIQRKISEAGKLRSPKAWSHAIDRAIRKGIVAEGTRHLVGDMDIFDLWYFGGTLVLPQLITSALIGEAMLTLQGNGFFNMVDRLSVQNRRKNGSLDPRFGFRWSLIKGPQLDRAAILYARSKTSSVVKPIGKRDLMAA